MKSPVSPAPATHWPRVLVLWLCGIVAAMQFAKVSFAFVALQQWYAVTPARMGLALSTVGMVGLVFGVTVGLLAPAIGYRRLLVAGMGLGAVLSLLQTWMLPFPLFWLTRVLEGASHLAVVVAAPTLMAGSCAPQHRSVVMGLWSTFVGVGYALTGAAAGWIMARWGLSGLLLAHAVAMGVMALAAWLAVEAGPGAAHRPGWPRLASLPRLHGQIYTRLATALPGLTFFCYTVMALALLTFIPQRAGADAAWLGVVLPLMSIAGNFLAGWLAQHWLSPLLLMRLAYGAVALAGIALAVSDALHLALGPAGLSLLLLSGLAGGASFALIPHLSHEPALQARATGAIAQMGNLGSTLGPPLFALLMVPLGVAGIALPVVLFALAGVAMAAFGERRHHPNATN